MQAGPIGLPQHHLPSCANILKASGTMILGFTASVACFYLPAEIITNTLIKTLQFYIISINHLSPVTLVAIISTIFTTFIATRDRDTLKGVLPIFSFTARNKKNIQITSLVVVVLSLFMCGASTLLSQPRTGYELQTDIIKVFWISAFATTVFSCFIAKSNQRDN